MSRPEVQPLVPCASRAHPIRTQFVRTPNARSMDRTSATGRAAGDRRPAMADSTSCRAHRVQPLRFEYLLPGGGSTWCGPAPSLAEAARRAPRPPLLHRPGSARTSATSSSLAALVSCGTNPRYIARSTLMAASQGTPSSARPSPFDALSIQQPSACSCVLGRAAVPSTSPASPCMGWGARRHFVAGEVTSSTGVQATSPHSMEAASGGPLVDLLAQVSSAASSEAYTRTETPETTSAWSPTFSCPRRGQPQHRGDDGRCRDGGTATRGMDAWS